MVESIQITPSSNERIFLLRFAHGMATIFSTLTIFFLRTSQTQSKSILFFQWVMIWPNAIEKSIKLHSIMLEVIDSVIGKLCQLYSHSRNCVFFSFFLPFFFPWAYLCHTYIYIYINHPTFSLGKKKWSYM